MKKDFLDKLKNNQKTQAAVICSVVGAVLVLTAAVTIPVALHNRVKVEADAESAAITAEAEITESASVMITEPETVSASEATTEPTTAETTAQAANNNASAGKNTPANTNKGGGSNKSGGSDSSAQKPNGGSSSGGQSQQKPPADEQPNKKNPELDWTQADVDAAVAEAKQYAKSKGLIINSNKKFTVSIDGIAYNTSWSSPIDTRLDYKTNAKVDLHYQIDRFAKEAANDGVAYDINIFAENHGSYWEIYVVC